MKKNERSANRFEVVQYIGHTGFKSKLLKREMGEILEYGNKDEKLSSNQWEALVINGMNGKIFTSSFRYYRC
jgi:hypothetical protein